MSSSNSLENNVLSTATASADYRGRFAPSPTGLLHFGSLVAAVGSYLQARSNNGQWLLRFDDLDQARNQVGASDAILQTLHDYGFEWNGEVYYQLDHIHDYQAALETLLEQNMCYRCTCSRKSVQRAMQQQQLQVYPGYCKDLQRQDPSASIRIRVNTDLLQFFDRIQGQYQQRLATAVGDFIIKRSDQIFAYQLAVVVDDQAQKITEVVRGSDLLDNTPRQIFLQQCLKYNTPDYVHLPIALNQTGQKLSKQTGAIAISNNDISVTLYQALVFLGQAPPESLQFESQQDIWRWAMSHWRLDQVKR